MKKKKKTIIIVSASLVVIALIIVGFQIKASFATASHGTTNEYLNDSRTSGNPIEEYDSVKIDKLIPDEYSFQIFKDINVLDNCAHVGGQSFNTDEYPTTVDKWVGKVRDNFRFVHTGVSDNDTDGHETNANGTPIKKGEFLEKSIVCPNIGSYKGKNVGLKITLLDYEIKDSSDADHAPFIGFYSPNRSQRLGVYAANINWVQVEYEFYDSITKEGYDFVFGNPIEVKGNITYNDIDYNQGVHLLDNTDGIYIRNNSKLKYTNLNETPYIYSDNLEDTEGLHNPESSFTELFTGSSLNRVYTFADKSENVEDASGAIWNTDLASGASIEYDSSSKAALGRGVKKGETIKYKVTYTNDDINNSQTITIKSILSSGLEYVKGSAGSVGDPKITTDSSGKSTLTWNIKMNKNSLETMTFEAKVTDGNAGIVTNQLSISSTNGTEYNDLPIMKNSVPNKSFDSDSEEGKNGSPVTPGSKMKYNVKYANVYNDTKTVTITETLSKYLTYVKNSSNLGEPVITKESNGKTKLVWVRQLEKDISETLTYEVKVSEDAVEKFKLSSKTVIKIGDEETISLDALTNKVTLKKLIKKPVQKEETPGNLAILIRDSYTKMPVKNGKYILYNEDNTTIVTDTNGNYLENKESDENGVVEWSNVPYGKYILKEVEPSSTFKSGFYEYNADKKELINTISFVFNEESDALKWYNQGNYTGGKDSGEPYIERDNVHLGDINSDGEINIQDLTLIKAIYDGQIEYTSDKEKIRYLVAADVDNKGKCNDGDCRITKNDIEILEEYINNKDTKPFEVNKTIYLKGSYQKRAAVSLLAVPLDLKISNLEIDTPKKIKGAKFVVKAENGTVYGNIEMDDVEKSIYLAPGNYTITEEEAKEGYVNFEQPILISMGSEGNVTLLEDYEDYVKINKSSDGDTDYLEVYNMLGDAEINVPYLEEEEHVVRDTVKQVAKVTSGGVLVIASASAAAIRYGVSYKLILSKLIGLIKL